jgi:hypothetical protein
MAGKIFTKPGNSEIVMNFITLYRTFFIVMVYVCAAFCQQYIAASVVFSPYTFVSGTVYQKHFSNDSILNQSKADIVLFKSITAEMDTCELSKQEIFADCDSISENYYGIAFVLRTKNGLIKNADIRFMCDGSFNKAILNIDSSIYIVSFSSAWAKKRIPITILWNKK